MYKDTNINKHKNNENDAGTSTLKKTLHFHKHTIQCIIKLTHIDHHTYLLSYTQVYIYIYINI